MIILADVLYAKRNWEKQSNMKLLFALYLRNHTMFCDVTVLQSCSLSKLSFLLNWALLCTKEEFLHFWNIDDDNSWKFKFQTEKHASKEHLPIPKVTRHHERPSCWKWPDSTTSERASYWKWPISATNERASCWKWLVNATNKRASC